MIRVQDLKIHYGEFVAVDNLSFAVKKGTVYGLIGPNGAGKTTTIKAIATLLEPTYGEILVDDMSVLHEPENARRALGYMPDFPPVYDDLRVEEFCDLFAHAYGLTSGRRLEKVDEALARTHLLDKRREFCKSLSRGMKQRVLLAKTLVHEPSVLLLDEPGANLDPKARIELRKLLRELADEGKTILLSSHVLTELQDLCDEIGIMRNGRMAVSGSIDEITRRRNDSQTLEIELLEPTPKFETFIAKHPELEGSTFDDSNGRFEVSYRGGRERAARILRELIAEGFLVSSFSTKRSKVEDLFLEVESTNSKQENFS